MKTSSSVETVIENYYLTLLRSGSQNGQILKCTVNTEYFLGNVSRTITVYATGGRILYADDSTAAMLDQLISPRSRVKLLLSITINPTVTSSAEYPLFFRTTFDLIFDILVVSYYMRVDLST